MSTSNLLDTRFDDSEEEDDNFNPQPADLSDVEDAGGSDHDDRIQNEASRRQEVNDRSDEELPISKRSSADDRGGNENEDDEDEDAEGEGEPGASLSDVEDGRGANIDEDDEEDDDEEEITVSHSEPLFNIFLGISIVGHNSLLQYLMSSLGPSQKASTGTSQQVPRC